MSTFKTIFKALHNNLVGVNPTRNVEVSEEALISCLHLKRKMPGGLLFLSAVCDVTCHGNLVAVSAARKTFIC